MWLATLALAACSSGSTIARSALPAECSDAAQFRFFIHVTIPSAALVTHDGIELSAGQALNARLLHELVCIGRPQPRYRTVEWTVSDPSVVSVQVDPVVPMGGRDARLTALAPGVAAVTVRVRFDEGGWGVATVFTEEFATFFPSTTIPNVVIVTP